VDRGDVVLTRRELAGLFLVAIWSPYVSAQRRGTPPATGRRGFPPVRGGRGTAPGRGRGSRGGAIPDGVDAYLDLEYVENGHVRQRLDLYVPEKPAGPLPLIVWVHGGGWSGGSKASPTALPLTARGFAVASIEYRLSQHAVFPAQIEDCKAAVRWLRANAGTYDLDPQRFGAWGSSAGGHLVALLGTAGDAKELEGRNGHLDQTSRVQAVVDWFGPTDFLRMRGTHDQAGSPESRLIGGPIQQNKEKAHRANPIAYISPSTPPFLIMHGTGDRAVPFEQSELLAAELKIAGVEVTLVPLPGAQHGDPMFWSAPNMRRVEEFLTRHLKAR
jgi:acetyl esterase/lipase